MAQKLGTFCFWMSLADLLESMKIGGEILLNKIFGLPTSSCLNIRHITRWNLTP
jgi:hypothetical protein